MRQGDRYKVTGGVNCLRATDERTGAASEEEETKTKPERISVMTLAGEDGGGGEGGGGRRRHAAASRVCFHVVSSQIRRNEMRVRQTSGGREDGRGGGEALISL